MGAGQGFDPLGCGEESGSVFWQGWGWEVLQPGSRILAVDAEVGAGLAESD